MQISDTTKKDAKGTGSQLHLLKGRIRGHLFWLMEGVLLVLLVIMLVLMFGTTSQQETVTVIVSNSDSGQWAAFINGVKQAARDEDLNVVIAGTGRISGAAEQRTLIQQALEQGASALIVQPAPGSGSAAMLQEMAETTPLLLVADRVTNAALSSVGVDDYACGTALAAMLAEDYGGSLSGKTIGIINHSLNTNAAYDREQGFLAGLKGKDGTISWQLRGLERTSQPEEAIANLERVDLVIALDDECLRTAGAVSESRNLRGALVYGIGSSVQNLYYLDHEDIQGMIYLNGFDAGYQSMQEIAQAQKNTGRPMESYKTGFLLLRKDDLFREENENLLFPVE